MTRIARCWRDRRGAAAVEFAIVGPILALMIVGLLEIGHAVYVTAILNGAVQAAGRSSGLESGNLSQRAIDEQVREAITMVVPDASITFRRANYQSFGDVGRPEDFTDANRNGVHDTRECFSDENGNGQWDNDVGRGGQGSASDVVLYTVGVAYPSFVPIGAAFGLPTGHRLSASTTLRNQPFATQPTRQVVQVCP